MEIIILAALITAFLFVHDNKIEKVGISSYKEMSELICNGSSSKK